MEPAVSVPMAAKPRPAATLAAEPPEEPPVDASGIPGIVDFSEETDHRTAAVGEFVEFCLPKMIARRRGDDGRTSASRWECDL